MKRVLTIIIVLLWGIGFGQNTSSNSYLPNITPTSPEASVLSKYTEIPVSNNSGIPSISIPIHEIKIKNFILPIAINYHSAGIRIDEISTSVGLGWNLNAGGMISVQVHGIRDTPSNRANFPSYRELFPTREAPINGSNIILQEDYLTLKAIVGSEGEQDSQPDVFFYNCGNMSGKFFFSDDGSIHAMPYSPIKIKGYVGNNVFEVTDEMGTKFTFNTTEEIKTNINTSITSGGDMFGGGGGTTTNYVYYVTKIENINNEIINFNYIDQSYTYKLPVIKSRYKTAYTLPCTNFNLFQENTTIGNVQLFGKLLKSITTNTNEIVTFNYDDCARLDLPPSTNYNTTALTGGFALNSIEVNKNNKKDVYSFNHAYFNLANFLYCSTPTDPNQQDSYRLKLISLKKNNENPYVFTYNENGTLPSRLENSFDEWGYFKEGGTGTEYPNDYIFSFYENGNRNPELNSTKLGVLNKIKYPTGGYSVFDYELNEFYGYKPAILINPPLNKSIGLYLNFPSNTMNEITYLSQTFTIGTDVMAGSIIMQKNLSPQITVDDDNLLSIGITDSNNNWQNINSTIGQELVLNLQPGAYTLYVSGTFNGGGASVKWAEGASVGENILGNHKIGGLRIKSIFEYNSNCNTQPLKKKFFEYNQFSNIALSSGKAILPKFTYHQTIYETQCNVCGLCPRRFNMTYLTQDSRNILALNGFQGYHVLYTNVRIYDDELKRNGYSDFKYSFVDDDNRYHYKEKPSTPVTSFDFKKGDLLEQIDYKCFGASNFRIIKKNTFEYFYNFSEPTSQIDFFLHGTKPNEKHELGLDFKVLDYEKTCVSCQEIYFFPMLYDLGYYKLYSIWKYLKKRSDTIFDLNGQNPITTLTNFNYNNPIHCQLTSQLTTNSKNEIIETKYFYPHDLISEPFMNDLKVANIIGNPIVTQTFGGTKKLSEQKTVYAKDATTNNLLLPKYILAGKENNLENKITYNKYDNIGNIQQYTTENGTPVCIIYGYNQTVPIAKIENATYAQVQAYETNLQNLSNNANSEASLLTALNSLRNIFPNAMITTYTHKPLIGVSTITDPKGDIVRYFYDAFNRLDYVLDKNGNRLSENQYNYRL